MSHLRRCQRYHPCGILSACGMRSAERWGAVGQFLAETSSAGFCFRSLLVYNFHMLASTRDDVVTKIKANRRALKRYGVKSLALFGSTARDKMRKRSDVDVLVQFDKSTWANYIGLKFYLEDLLGREVDLVTPKALKPATKPSIEKDLLYVVS